MHVKSEISQRQVEINIDNVDAGDEVRVKIFDPLDPENGVTQRTRVINSGEFRVALQVPGKIPDEKTAEMSVDVRKKGAETWDTIHTQMITLRRQ